MDDNRSTNCPQEQRTQEKLVAEATTLDEQGHPQQRISMSSSTGSVLQKARSSTSPWQQGSTTAMDVAPSEVAPFTGVSVEDADRKARLKKLVLDAVVPAIPCLIVSQLIGLYLPFVCYLTYLMHNTNNRLAHYYNTTKPVPFGLILVSFVATLICLPHAGQLPPQLRLIDPLIWIYAIAQSAFFWKVGEFLEKRQNASQKHAWKIPIALSFSVNAYLLVTLANGTFFAFWWFCSQLWGIIFINFFLERVKALSIHPKQNKFAQVNSERVIIPLQTSRAWQRWLKPRSSTIQNKSDFLPRTLCAWFAVPVLLSSTIASVPIWISLGTALGSSVEDAARSVEQGNRGRIANSRGGSFSGIDQSSGEIVPAQTPDNQAQQNVFLIYIALLGMGTLSASLAIFLLTRPTHLALTKDGFGLVRSPQLSQPELHRLTKWLIPWSEIVEINLSRPAGKTSPLDSVVNFHRAGKRPIQVALSAIDSVESKEALLTAIGLFVPDKVRTDPQLREALEPPPDHSYTELWLQALSAPPQRERLKPLVPGTSLQNGKISVTRSLGVGGQGQAYLAKDHASRCDVVLKEFLLPVFVDVDVRRSALMDFEHEARILRQLHHDGIVELMDCFVEDHRAYLVLEYIQGASLRNVIQESGPMEEHKARELMMQMCNILEYLHSRTPPLVHRDFTPDNLILRPDGTLKLIDFNVAKHVDSTRTGTIVGKHNYLPPEQFRGEPVPQSDIYAFGATVFYLVSGSDPEAISVSSPKNFGCDVSDNFDSIVRKATAVDWMERYPSVAEIVQDLKM